MGLLSALGGLFQSDEDRAAGNLNGLQRFGMALNDNSAPVDQGLRSVLSSIPAPSPNDIAGQTLYKAAQTDPKSYLSQYASHMQDFQSNPLNYGLSNGTPSPVLTSNNSPAANPITSAQGGVLGNPDSLKNSPNTNQPNDGKNYDYLNSQVPPVYRNIVKGMIEGQDIPVNLRGDPKLGAALKIWASNVDPSFSDSTYEARNKTLKDFSSGGKESNSIIAGQTALEHLANFVQNVNKQGNSPVQPVNWLGSLVGGALGDPNVLRAKGDKATLASELATFYKGGTPTDSGTNEMMDILSTNQGKSGTNAMANEVGTLMKGKIKSLRDQYNTSMGDGAADKRNIFSSGALKVLEDLGVDTSDITQPNHPAKTNSGATSATGQPPQQKIATQQDVAAAAAKTGKSIEQVMKDAQAKGYTIK